ncbi:B2 protein [Bienertia sinuspersici]
MTKASGVNNSSAPADVSATSQPLDSNNTPMPSSAVNVEKKADVENHIAGYIFMCNTGTKQDCFRYRVFGVPASRLWVVQKIKPNTKLFLFDFDAKLLYGLYVADTSGRFALEPYAFGGRFPAQVRFSIAKDCLPLPEEVLKDAIKENYTGSKFKQELSDEQVNKLVPLFRPIEIPSPPLPSLGFTDALRSLYQKHLEPSHQVSRYAHMHNERSVSEVPQVASTSSYYGQNPMPQSNMTPISPAVAPSSSMPSSSSRVSHLVAVAAHALNAEDQTSSFMSPSRNMPGLSHANVSHNSSNIREVGYGRHDRVSPSPHLVISVSNRAMHRYGMHPYSGTSFYPNQGNANLTQTPASRNHGASVDYGHAHNQGVPALPQIQPSVNADNSNPNFNGPNSANLAYDYQNQGNATLPQTLVSGSNSASVGNTYLDYNSRNQPSNNYLYAHNKGVPAFPQIQPAVDADNLNLNYNGTDSANPAYDYRGQVLHSSHQPAVGQGIQPSNYVPQVHQPYYPGAPGYINQVHQPYYPGAPGDINQVHQPYYPGAPSDINQMHQPYYPVAGADVTAGYAPVGGSRV